MMQNLLLDVDTGEDDAVAILLALVNDLPLKCVVTSYGNTTLDNATRNTFRLLRAMGRNDIPVLRGSDEPLNHHPIEHKDAYAAEFVGPNGLCNIELPSPEECLIEPKQERVPEVLADCIRRHSPLTYIVTGPMTNLARALEILGPEAKNHIEQLYVMGGSLYVPGNTGPLNPATGMPFAEFNFYCDAQATDSVLSYGFPTKIVTWDTTSSVTLRCGALHALKCNKPVGEFVKQLMGNFCHIFGHANQRDFEFNDPLTVMAALGHGHWKNERISVVTEGEEYGRTVVSEDGYPVEIYSLSDEEKIEMICMMLKMLSFEDPETVARA